MPTPHELLMRLDSRHEELLRKLDELNGEIEQVLAQFAQSRTSASEPAVANSSASSQIQN